MTEQEAIVKIKEIYNDFLSKLDELKDRADQKTKNQIQSIEQKDIDKILDKIHNQL
ncbi:hypothetical protein HN670_03050 [bacterium]|jgi:hypothetical protein|nr:hypothetical protein [bacterium]